MVRIKRGQIARNRRKKILKASEGFRGANHTLSRLANQRNVKAQTNMYTHRKLRKRGMRRLWIVRLNSILRAQNQNYHHFIYTNRVHHSKLNRKIWSQIYLYDANTMIAHCL